MCHIVIKTLIIQNKEAILKAAREKRSNNIKADLIKIHPTFQWRLLKPERSGQMSCRLQETTDESPESYTQKNIQSP